MKHSFNHIMAFFIFVVIVRDINTYFTTIVTKCSTNVYRLLMLLPILGPSSLPVVVAQPDKRHANRSASVDRHRA